MALYPYILNILHQNGISKASKCRLIEHSPIIRKKKKQVGDGPRNLKLRFGNMITASCRTLTVSSNKIKATSSEVFGNFPLPLKIKSKNTFYIKDINVARIYAKYISFEFQIYIHFLYVCEIFGFLLISFISKHIINKSGFLYKRFVDVTLAR